MTVLEQIGERLATPPAATDDRLALHVLDTVGAWIAGGTTEEAHHLAKLKTAHPFAVLGSGAPDQLALRVGTTRLSEIDDIHLPSCTTGGAIVVTTALAMAGNTKTSAITFAHALRDGYGLMSALGTAICGPTVLRRGVWPTYFLAPVAAAAVTARMLGLEAMRTANAIAIALTMTSGGVADPPEVIPRWLLVGMAARQGCVAGVTAANGFSGDRRLLDDGSAPTGAKAADPWLVRVHGIECDAHVLTAAMPAMSTMSMKPYCAAKQTMAGIEAFLQLVKGIAPEEIAAIKVYTLPTFVGMTGHRDISSRTGRLTGLPFQLATAVYHPGHLYDVNRPELPADSRVTRLIERTEVIGDPELTQYFPQSYPARVEITTQRGRKEAASVTAAWGDPGHQFSAEEVKVKFHRLADPVIGGTEAEACSAAALASTTDDGALAELCRRIEAIPTAAALP